MFCPKCGKPVEEGQTLCPECLAAAAPAQEAAAPVQEAPVQAPVIPVQETPAPEEINLNLSGEESPAPAKKKKPIGKIILAVIAALTAGALAYGFIWGGLWYRLVNFFNRTFQDPEEYKNTVESNALTREDSKSDLALAKRGVTQVYGAYVNALNMGDGAAAVSLRMELGNELANLINSAASMDDSADIEATKEFLDVFRKVEFKVDTNITSNATSAEYDFLLNDEELVGMKMIIDSLNGKIYMGVSDPEDVNSDYVRFDMNEMMSSMSEDAAIAGIPNASTAIDPQAAATMIELASQLPSEEEFSAMLDAFIMAAIGAIDDVEEERKSMTAGGVTEKFTVLTYTITESTAADMSVAVLEEATTNATFRKFLEAIANVSASATGETISVDETLAEFDNMAETLKSGQTLTGSSEALVIKTYVDNKGFIRGRTIVLDELVGQSIEITYLSATSGRTQGFNFEVKSGIFTMVQLEGSATKKKDLITGTYEVSTIMQDVAVIELKDFNTETFTGTIQFKPGKYIVDALESSEPAISFLDLSKLMLELKLGENALDAGIYLNNKLLISAGASYTAGESTTVTIPSNAVDGSYAEATEQWSQQIQSALEDKLDELGLDDLYENAMAESNNSYYGY